jgi:hypothetical protein
LKEVSLAAIEDGKHTHEKASAKKGDDQYLVMGIEDEGNARVNGVFANQRQLVPQSLQLSLLQDDDDLESKLTSVSSKNVKLTKSLGTVLS